MPTYTYQCKKCAYMIDQFKAIAKRDECPPTCEACGHSDMKRVECQGSNFTLADGGHKAEYTKYGPRKR